MVHTELDVSQGVPMDDEVVGSNILREAFAPV